jgi:hypothetical protein
VLHHHGGVVWDTITHRAGAAGAHPTAGARVWLDDAEGVPLAQLPVLWLYDPPTLLTPWFILLVRRATSRARSLEPPADAPCGAAPHQRGAR